MDCLPGLFRCFAVHPDFDLDLVDFLAAYKHGYLSLFLAFLDYSLLFLAFLDYSLLNVFSGGYGVVYCIDSVLVPRFCGKF